MAEGDTKTVNEIMAKINNAAGVNNNNKQAIKDLVNSLDISDDVKQAIEEIDERSKDLNKIKSFSGTSNSTSHSNLLNAISIGEKDLDNTDFSFLTREELKDL
jgi:hypothetical protein